MTTRWALSNGATEQNRIVLALGWYWAASLKGLLCLGLIAGAWKQAGPSVYDRALQFTVVLYLAVCVINLKAAL